MENNFILVGQGNIAVEFSSYLLEYASLFPSDHIQIAGYLSVEGEENKFAGKFFHLGEAMTHQPMDKFAYVMCCDPVENRNMLNTLKSKGAKFIKFVHPDARLGENVKIGQGSMIGPHAQVQSGSRIGEFNLLEMHAMVAVFSKMEDFNRLSVKAYVGPDCQLGSGNYLGLNSNVLSGIEIGNHYNFPAGLTVGQQIQLLGLST